MIWQRVTSNEWSSTSNEQRVKSHASPFKKKVINFDKFKNVQFKKVDRKKQDDWTAEIIKQYGEKNGNEKLRLIFKLFHFTTVLVKIFSY